MSQYETGFNQTNLTLQNIADKKNLADQKLINKMNQMKYTNNRDQ